MAGSEKRNELVVGLFLLIGLVLLGSLILQFGRFEEYFANQYRITVVFDDASGLIKGSDVRMGGARIGRVAKLPELTETVQVEVELAIDERIRIPEGSSFQIESATLLGDKLIVINPPDERTGAFIKPGSRLRGEGPTGLEALQDKARIVSEEVIRILGRAETTFEKVDLAVEEIQKASQQLGEATRKVNGSLLADDNLARFDQTMTHLAEATRRFKDAGDQLEPTLTEARSTISEIKTAASNMTATLASADETLANIKPAFSGVPAAVGQISDTAEKAGDALDRMKRGEGMLGAFASDNEVSLDFKAFMRNLRRNGILFYRDEKPETGKSEPSTRSPIRHGSKL